MTQLCPYTQICPIYKNWTEQTRDRRVDVIISELGERNKLKSFRYNCLALMAIFDQISEGGIPISDELRGQLSNPNRTECSHLTTINLLHTLLNTK